MASKRAWQQRMARPAAKPTPSSFFGTDDGWGDLSDAIDALPPLADADDQPARSACPDCGEPSHPDMGRYCWACGISYIPDTV